MTEHDPERPGPCLDGDPAERPGLCLDGDPAERPGLCLDGDPDSPISAAQGPLEALGRDPFSVAPIASTGPWLDALDRFQRESEASLRDSGSGEAEARGWISADDERRLEILEATRAAAFDPFGLEPAVVRRTLPALRLLYRHWFRVESEGHERLPTGRVVLMANHGGLLPFDGAMTMLDVFLETEPPRLARALVDPWVQQLPLVRDLFARTGQVPASRDNLRRLLEADEAVLVFPEGVDGIRKPLPERYRLQHFRGGFVSEALRAGAPIVPTVVVGAEDQAPILYDVKPLARLLGLPVFPITPTFPWFGPLGLLPYPVRYRIRYGRPIDLGEIHPGAARGPEARSRLADDREAVEAIAADLRRRLQHDLDHARGFTPSAPEGD